MLAELGIDRIHFHHTMGLNPKLWVLAADVGCDYDLTLHDYYLVNGNPTLTDAHARYVQDSAPDFDEIARTNDDDLSENAIHLAGVRLASDSDDCVAWARFF